MDLGHDFLKTFSIPRYCNLQCDEIGTDTYKHCFDKKHFKNFEKVNYTFNEIGFRTHSIRDFQRDAILAIGDSFTLGLGVNAHDRWTDQLEILLDHQVLNFSLNGASNDWIARKANELLQYFQPRCIIVHWSFSHRREKPFTDWHDDERTECEPFYSDEENFSNWLKNYQSINKPRVIHSVIPNWHDDFDYQKFSNVIAPIKQIDSARDSFHYGPKTHKQIAEIFYSRVTNLRHS